MIDKKRIWDKALIAVIQHAGFSCERNEEGSFTARISDEEFQKLLISYRKNYQPVLSKLRRLQTGLAKPIDKIASPVTEIRT